MQNAQVKQLINGPESFTPDGRYILGEAPEVSPQWCVEVFLHIVKWII